MVFTARSLVLLASLLTATNALNDWSRPCLAGTCSYDLPDADGQAASGSIRIWSDNKALITDITQAADWEIIGCSPDKLAQDIRIVCKSDDSDKCNHLLDGGAEGKIVRLPQNCGQNAFARIGRVWISDDQSVPQDIARRLVRRAGVPPQVRGVAIDTDFGAVDASKGKINFALRGANFQGAKGDIDVGQSNAARRRDLMARFGFGDIVGGIKDAAGAVANTAQAAAGAVANAGSAVVDAGQAAVNSVANTASNVASNVVDLGESAVDKVVDTAKTVEKKVEDTATKVVDKAKDVEKAVEKKVTDTAKDVKDAATKVVDKAKDVADKAVDKVVDTAKDVKDTATKVVDKAKDVADEAVDKVVDTAKDVADKAKDVATKAVGAAKNATEAAVDKVKDVAGDVVDKAKDVAGDVVDKAEDVVDKAKDVAGDVVDKAGDVVDKAKDVAGDVVDKAGDVVDKAKDVAGDVVDKAKDVAGDVVDAGKNVLDKAENVASNAVSAVKDAAGNAVNAAEDLGEEIVDKAQDGLDAVGDGAKKAIDFTGKVLGDLNNVSISESKTFPPLAINKQFNLVNQKVSCPGRSAGLTVDVNANAQVVVTVGIAAAGTIVPPNFEDFALTTTINGDISSSIDLKASVSGTLDSGKIEVLSVGVPGFSLPGIITIGPAFKIEAQALATLDLNVDVNVGVSYKIENVQAVFPPRNGDKVGTFSIGDTPLKLSASPSVAARGEVQAHIIPALTLGIDAIGGKAKADAFVNLDASAHAVLTLNANAEASASINTTGGKKRAGPARIEGRQVQTTASAGFGGCFDVFAQLDVNAGVEGSLFGIFDATKNFNLFTKKFDLFKKCFGNQARALPGLLMERQIYTNLSAHKRMSKVSRSIRHIEARALGCPKAGVADAKSVVDSANAAAAAQ